MVFKLEPWYFGRPVNRPRVYFVCAASKLFPAGTTYLQFRQESIAIMQKLVGHKCDSLDALLLDEADPIILQRQEFFPQRDLSDSQGTWVQKHCVAHEARSPTVPWAASRAGAPSLRSYAPSYAGLRELTSRELDILEDHGVRGPRQAPLLCFIRLS